MARNKTPGHGRTAKGDGKGKGQDKSDAGGMEENQGSARDHKWNDLHDEIQVRHILCEKHSNKEQALARLKAGENFDVVARAFAEHKRSDGGLLPKWYKKDELKFGDVAFTLEVSSVTNPKIAERKTDQGYHIIMVEGRRKAKAEKK